MAKDPSLHQTVRIPFMVSEKFVDRIDKYASEQPTSSRAEAMRELMEIGIELPRLCIDLLDALEAEGLLYFEDIAEPVRAMEAFFDIDSALEFTQVEKDAADGKPYLAVRDVIFKARKEIEEAKARKPKVRKKVVLKKKIFI